MSHIVELQKQMNAILGDQMRQQHDFLTTSNTVIRFTIKLLLGGRLVQVHVLISTSNSLHVLHILLCTTKIIRSLRTDWFTHNIPIHV